MGKVKAGISGRLIGYGYWLGRVRYGRVGWGVVEQGM